MADKDIDIRIKATGAEQAAAEVAKVQEAATELTEAATEATEQQAAAVEELGEAAEEAGEQSGKLDENVERISQIQKAQAVAQLANIIGNIGKQLQLASKDAEGFDASLAAKMRSTGEAIENVSGKINSMAQGFAVGGPLGAGLALNLELLKEAVVAWFDMAGAIDAADAAEARAVEMQGRLNLALAGVVDPALEAVDVSNALADSYEKEREALDKLISSNRARNEILDATDAANAAKRDREDAARIRGGEAKEDVQAERALYDAAVAKAKIDREFQAKQQEELKLRELANAAEAGLRDLEGNAAADPKDVEARRRDAELARRQASQATESLSTLGATSELRKRAIDDQADGTVESSLAAKEARLAKEKETADRKAEREAQLDAAKAQREEARKAREMEQGQRGAADVGRRAEKLLPEGVSRQFRAAVQAAAERLQDGDQGGELQELARLLNELGGSTNSTVSKIRTDLAAIKNEIAILRKQGRDK